MKLSIQIYFQTLTCSFQIFTRLVQQKKKMEIKGIFWRFWRVSISGKMERIRSPAIYHSKEKKQKRRCGSKWPWIFAIRPLFVLVQPFYHATIWSPTAWSIIFYRILGTKMEEAGGGGGGVRAVGPPRNCPKIALDIGVPFVFSRIIS